MNIDQLRYFIQIANSGNLSKASEKLNISQPALSKYLANLDESMNMQLFVSEKRKMVLTPVGKIYYDMALRIINVQNQTTQTVNMILNREVETIRVGASPHRGSQLIGKIFSKFSQKYPDVLLEMNECYQEEGLKYLQNNEIDLLLGTTDNFNNNTVNKVVMYSEEVFLSVPIYHPLASKSKYKNGKFASISPALFINDPWAVVQKGATLHRISEQVFNECKMSPSIVFQNKNFMVVNAILNQGGGVGLMLETYINLEQNDTVYFSLENKKYIYVTAFYNKDRNLTDAEKYLLGLIIETDKNTSTLTASRNEEASEIYNRFCEETIIL